MNLKIIVLSLVAGILLFAGYLASFKYLKLAPEPRQTACTMEAKLCPDGSAVGRTGPNCEFAACPNFGTSDVQKFDVSGWQTYRNEEYGFEVKYPIFISVKELGEGVSFEKDDEPFVYFTVIDSRILGISFCAANPQDKRCEIIVLGGRNIIFTWVESEQMGAAEFNYNELFYRFTLYGLTENNKQIFKAILSTFKFIE